MTPLEMARLFSSFIAATFLIWLTNFSEREPKPADALAVELKPHVNTPPLKQEESSSWNVSSFFVFKGV